MSDAKQIKQPIEIAAGGRDDALIRTYVPTGTPAPDVNPLASPPFEIGGPAGQPVNGTSQTGGSGKQSRETK